MSDYVTTHLPPSEIDQLRFKAFATNDQGDVMAYYKATSLYFQERDCRAMNRADRIEELEAKLAEAMQGLENAMDAGMAYSYDRLGYDRAVSLLNRLKGEQDD